MGLSQRELLQSGIQVEHIRPTAMVECGEKEGRVM